MVSSYNTYIWGERPIGPVTYNKGFPGNSPEEEGSLHQFWSRVAEQKTPTPFSSFVKNKKQGFPKERCGGWGFVYYSVKASHKIIHPHWEFPGKLL